MAIQKNDYNKPGFFDSKLFKMIESAGGGALTGFALGGPVGAAIGGSVGTAAGALAPDSTASKVYGVANKVASFVPMFTGGKTEAIVPEIQSVEENFKQPELGSQFKGSSPDLGMGNMARRLQSQQQSPEFIINQGLEALKDPYTRYAFNPDDYATVVDTLLGSKYKGIS